LIKSQNAAPNVDLRIFISYFLENVIVKVDIRTLDVPVKNIKKIIIIIIIINTILVISLLV